ncbi:hypothetical protein EVAR_40105_1 [Eumeta japonica]|uniref:Uncharacterized protein n=1 Tax=Eumeta variegata TaxID=151549 RepID=A0A4C1WAK9_EUMVA|nr:hypothetical protein EVAR_40105_1 [Eumeta japonica]
MSHEVHASHRAYRAGIDSGSVKSVVMNDGLRVAEGTDRRHAPAARAHGGGRRSFADKPKCVVRARDIPR